MKIKIALGAAMLLTLGSAVAGGLMYKTNASVDANAFESGAATSAEVTPEMIAAWKATAKTGEYSSPMLPI